jgi:hypothetical protein
MIDITPEEQQRLIVEAKLAKAKNRLEELRIKAQSLFEKMSQRHGVVTERRNEPLKIAIEMDISRVEPGVLSLWADDFGVIVKEVTSILDQEEKLEDELQSLRTKAKMNVQISF